MNRKDLRIIFMGTPEFAVESLKALVDGGYNIVAVVTQPDKPVGRHQDHLQPSAVKQYAISKGLPVLQPEKMKNPEFVEKLRSYKADLQVVVAFRMLPEIVWAMPRFGTFNVHAALLPQYRGAAPINWAVINGEKETGVTTFFLDKNIDTGRIILQKRFPIPDDADVEYVYDGLMHLGAQAALETVDRLIEGNGHVDSIPQATDDATLLHPAPKIFKDTRRINWKQPAENVYNFIRGLSPYPCAWTEMKSEDNTKALTMKIFKSKISGQQTDKTPGTITSDKGHLFISTAKGTLEVLEIQLSGKKRMSAHDFLNGFHDISKYHVE